MKNVPEKIVGNVIAQVLEGKVITPPPIWLMRQAGRYLPEYREVRRKAGGFVELCLTPNLAAEVTLQPVRRFHFDAAIIFSDILIVPYALGVKLWFEEGEGPRLDPVTDSSSLKVVRQHLNPTITQRVYEALAQVRRELAREVALIGFCGAPWTVASYMVAGKGTQDQGPARQLAKSDPKLFGEIINRLAFATAEHLIGQLRAGADVVQIFDTWAGVLDVNSFERWCVEPTVKIVSKIRKVIPSAKIILFPKGIPVECMDDLVKRTSADGIGIDQFADRQSVRRILSDQCAVQGNLDPDILIEGGAELDKAVDTIKEDFRGVSHIFNLGHGIKPETPISNVERMIARIRES